ncbi:MAG: 50S ribosomal protein L11 methyltransferase [Thermodesulfobacteriota bacterium]
MTESRSPGWSYRLSSRLVLCTHCPPTSSESKIKVVVVRRGEAFPPGHPTTSLCLDLLRETMAAKVPGSLLDVGCGAGVVSLAAAALGVPLVVGVDISWGAAQTTRDNTRDNGLAGSVRVAQGSTECIKRRFEVVAANLPWEVQREKVAELDRLTAPQGALILSGFRDNQENHLMESYQKLGWRLNHRLSREFCHPELPPDISFTWVAWLLKRF